MKPTMTTHFLLAWFLVLLAPQLAHSKTPYAGNQGNPTRPTIVPTAPPVTPVSQGKPIPIQNPYTGKEITKEPQK